MGYKNVQSLQGNQCMFKGEDRLILFKLKQATHVEWKMKNSMEIFMGIFL
jgi:hypothetical protein